jgi:hypothetical protein
VAIWAEIPLGWRWVLTFLMLSSITATLIIGVHEANHDRAAVTNPQALAESDRVGQIAVAEDEAPHTANLRRGASTVRVLEAGITGDMRLRISQRQLAGPIQDVSCHASGRTRMGRTPYRCTVSAADFNYPFFAVADPRTRLVTWCKYDTPPSDVPALNVPVSADCRAG